MGVSGHTATHDFQILVAGECFDRCDNAYIIGLEARGVSTAARKYMESGKCRFMINPALETLDADSLDKTERIRYARGGHLTRLCGAAHDGP